MSLKIHPGIGVARAGNSPDGWFIGPETIEIPDVPVGGYRDDNCLLKRQAARFRVFVYDDSPGGAEPVEASFPTHTITWTVTVGKYDPVTSALVQSTLDITGPNQVQDFPRLRSRVQPCRSGSCAPTPKAACWCSRAFRVVSSRRYSTLLAMAW